MVFWLSDFLQMFCFKSPNLVTLKILRPQPGVQLLTIRQLKGYIVYFPSKTEAGLDVRVRLLQTSLILLWEKDDLEVFRPHSPRLSTV